MSKKNKIASTIEEGGIMAIIRTKKEEDLSLITESLLSGGIKTIEISLTTPGALKWIKKLSKQFGKDINLGVGTVTSAKEAKQSLQSGAKYLVTPVLNKKVIALCNAANTPIFCGAFTPTEIFNAHAHGADFVKVFPAEALGVNYIKSIKAPLPNIKLMPTGGVNIKNLLQWFEAGASVVGVGSTLFNEKMLEDKNYDQIQTNAASLVKVFDTIRN